MTYPFDPELAPWVAMLPKSDISDPVASRAAMRKLFDRMPEPELPESVTIRDTTVPGPDGAPNVPVRIYSPSERRDPLPALVYIHGGGFVLGDLDTSHAAVAGIAAEVGVVVVSVDYRLAPEHPFPAGLEDCYAVLKWTAAAGDTLGIDPARIAIGGESAGGGLAAGLALLARDRGGPAVRFQYLGIPELDDRLETPSMIAFTDTPIWNRPNAIVSWKHYLAAGTVVDGRDCAAYAAPARATDLSGLPPAYVSVCEFDPLRDEGLDYAIRLLQAGVSTEMHHYPGTFHGTSLVREAAIAKRMIADEYAALRRALHPEV